MRNLYDYKVSTVHLSHVKMCQENELFHQNQPNYLNSSVYHTTSYNLDIELINF